MIHDAENDQLTRIWQYMYEGINRANYMVENKDKMDFTRKAELYFHCGPLMYKIK